MSSTPQKSSPLYARTVARALTQVLEDSNTTVHWVNVVGESSLDTMPSKVWPTTTTPMFNVMVQDGWSEGTLLYVYAQEDRYKPQEVTPLLQIKMLGSRKTVCNELPIIMSFLDQIENIVSRTSDLQKYRASLAQSA